MKRKIILSMLTAALLCGCADNTAADNNSAGTAGLTETTTVSDSMAEEQTESETVPETDESVTYESTTDKSVTYKSATDSYVTESASETVLIAGKEYPIDATYVSIDVTADVADEVTHTVDVSGLGKLKNLQGFSIYDRVDGGNYTVSGLSALEGSETINSVYLQVVLYDKNDIHIFETMPNLKEFTLYGIALYNDFEFNFSSVEKLELVGDFDLTKITHLTSLKDLCLEYNDSDDLSPITNLPQLEGLKITECGFEDYSPLLEMSNLTGLWISSNPMTEEMYNNLTEQLPDCKITVINSFID